MSSANDHNHVLLYETCPYLPTGRDFRKEAKEATAQNRGFEMWVFMLEQSTFLGLLS